MALNFSKKSRNAILKQNYTIFINNLNLEIKEREVDEVIFLAICYGVHNK
jgi:hypothetical protein